MKKEEDLTPDKAKELLEKDQQKRQADCIAKVNAALKEYGMTLSGRPTFTADGRVIVQVGVVSAQ